MNANNEFDKLVKDKLAQGLTSVPKDMKVSIERKLVSQGLIKKDGQGRRLFFVIFSVIVFVGILTAIVFKFYRSDSDAGISKTLVEEKDNVQSKTISSNILNKDDDQKSDSSIINKERNNLVEKPKSESNVSKVRSKVDLVDRSNTLQISSDDQKKSNKKLSAQLKGGDTNSKNLKANKMNLRKSKSEKEQTPIDLNVISSKEDGKSDKLNTEKNEDETSGNSVIYNGENGSTLKQNELDNLNSKNDIENNFADNRSLNRNANSSKEDLITNKTANANSDLTLPNLSADSLQIDSSKSVTAQIERNHLDSLNADSSKVATDAHFNFHVDIFGGIQQTYLQGSTNSSGTQGSSSSGNSSEWIAGFKFGVKYKKHFTLGAGLNFSMHHSEVSEKYESFLLDSSGVTTTIFPAHVNTDFNVIDFPILLGYYFEANKFAFHVESGISFSQISKPYSVLVVDNSPVTIDNYLGVIPVKTYSNYVGQLSVLYSFGRHFQVFLQPSISIGLTEIFLDMPEKRINMVSGKAGLRINL